MPSRQKSVGQVQTLCRNRHEQFFAEQTPRQDGSWPTAEFSAFAFYSFCPKMSKDIVGLTRRLLSPDPDNHKGRAYDDYDPGQQGQDLADRPTKDDHGRNR